MPPPGASDQQRATQVFRAALDLVGRLGLVTVATVGVLGAADLGFSLMLSRDAARSPAKRRPMLRAAYEVAVVWSAFLTLVLIALAFSAGLSSDRGLVLLVLAPSLLFSGLNPARTFMVIAQRTRLLVLIDVLVLIIQVGASVFVAKRGGMSR